MYSSHNSTKPTEPQAQTPPQDSPAPAAAAAAGGEASGLNIDDSLIESNWDTVTDK
jgi:3-oxoacyl-ACP reductase-like protein